MRLGDLIARLESLDPSLVFYHGFKFPHFYHYYAKSVAFVPIGMVTVRSMLESCKQILGKDLKYKDKQRWIHINEDCFCWLAELDNQGDPIYDSWIDQQLQLLDLMKLISEAASIIEPLNEWTRRFKKYDAAGIQITDEAIVLTSKAPDLAVNAKFRVHWSQFKSMDPWLRQYYKIRLSETALLKGK